MSPAKKKYLARSLVSVTEGGMYGPGEPIAGAFDAKDPHNAALIESGAIFELPPKGKPASPKRDGGEASSPSMEGDQ